MKLNQCPLCDGTKIVETITAKDHLVSGESFRIYHCHSCDLKFTNPRPDDNGLANYYNSDEYISHTNEGSSLVNRLYKVARKFTLNRKRQLIDRLGRNKKMLDIGCGTGHFISICQRHGWQVTGVEPNIIARRQAVENTNGKIHETISQVNDSPYDVITLWHVLEHLPNLKEVITQLKSLLTKNGVLIIAVPNHEAYESTIFKEYWAAYDVPRHLYHFNRQALYYLTEKNGLKIVKTYPMWLDSFYISLLSNKYQYNRNRYVHSFITGLLSNIYAINSKNYSSLIYLIEKSEVQP
jgi:2-polyprenyl-3-methyl-5-hydroxy-6-metoxy-1,4-benzoquinol methylase